MFGRSSRRQGTQYGAGFLVGSNASRIYAWDMIKNREAAISELGGELVSIILKNLEKIKPSEYEVLMNGLKDDK